MKPYVIAIATTVLLLSAAIAVIRPDVATLALRVAAAGDGTTSALSAPPRLHQPISILLVGIDDRSGAGELTGKFGRLIGTRADAIMVVAVASDGITVTSIPRDLRVDAPRLGTLSLGAVREYGGASELIATIRGTLGIPIHHYVEVDFAGVAALVDGIGGIPYTSKTAIRDATSGLELPEGTQILDGSEFVGLLRSRGIEAKTASGWIALDAGDIARIDRRNQLLQELAVRWSGASVSDLIGILNQVRRNMTWDRSFSAWTVARVARRFVSQGPGKILWGTLPVAELRPVEERMSPFHPGQLGAGYWLILDRDAWESRDI